MEKCFEREKDFERYRIAVWNLINSIGYMPNPRVQLKRDALIELDRELFPTIRRK